MTKYGSLLKRPPRIVADLANQHKDLLEADEAVKPIRRKYFVRSWEINPVHPVNRSWWDPIRPDCPAGYRSLPQEGKEKGFRKISGRYDRLMPPIRPTEDLSRAADIARS